MSTEDNSGCTPLLLFLILLVLFLIHQNLEKIVALLSQLIAQTH